MKFRRILSFLLALLMTFSTFAEMIPANVFASEYQEENETEQTESTGEIIASYEIPMSDVGISEDGGFIINLPETMLPEAAQTEAPETEPAQTETPVTVPTETAAVETEAVETEAPGKEPTETQPEETVPAETVPAETETEETVPAETAPEETVPEETEETVPEETEPEAALEPLTWFEWIEENGIDTSDMTKEVYNDLFSQYSAYRINALAEMGELPDGAGRYGKINNDYIEFAVGSDGRFTIGNRIGNPGYTTDDNMILLFGHDDPWSSETLIVIDNKYSNLFTADSTTYNNNSKTATATMKIPSYNIEVVQTLKLVKTGTADFEDTVQIQYTVKNNDTKAHSVGIRIMMDTMLANNDDATFRVESVGNIVKNKEFSGSAIPSMYQVYDNLDNPTTLATGYLYRGSDTKPNKVQFCSWGNIVGSGWSHSINSNEYLGDSAVGIYFNPTSVRSGGSKTVKTYYGVSISSGGASSNTITDKMVSIQVQDSVTKKALEDVTISYTVNGTQKTVVTGPDGIALVEGGTAATLTLTKDDYKTVTTNCAMTPYSCYLYSMTLNASSKPLITSIMLDTGNSCKDLLAFTQTYDEDNKDRIYEKGKTGTIKIIATSDMKNCTFQFMEDDSVLQENKTGVFSLDIRKEGDKTYIDKLSPTGKRYIRCISSDGSMSQKMKFNLNVKAARASLEFFPLDMGEIWPSGTAFIANHTIGSLLLGNSAKFGPEGSKYSFRVDLADDGTLQVGLNIDANKWSTLSKYHEKKIDRLEEAMKKYLKGDKSEMNEFFAHRSKYKVAKAQADFDFFGYGSGKVVDGHAEVALNIYAFIGGSSGFTSQYLIGTVPAYIYVNGKFGGELEGKAVLYNSEGFQFNIKEAKVTPTFAITLGGGFGVKGCVAVGASGTGAVKLITDLLKKSLQVLLTANVKLEAEVFLWSKELPLAAADLEVYNSADKEGTVYDGGPNIPEALAATPYRLKPRSATNAEGGTSSAVTDVRILDVNGVQYKFFHADRGGNLSNRNVLAYSVLKDGVWSDGIAVMDDGTSDFYYDVATDGSNVYVVWSNCNQLFDDETVTVDQMGMSQEIWYTVISADGTIGEPVRLTNDSEMDVMPAITLMDGTAYIAWSHTANGIEYNTDVYDNYLYYTTITGDTVGEVKISNRGSDSINSVSAATIGGKPVATFVTNGSDEITFEENVTHEIVMSSGTVSTIEKTETALGKAVTAQIDGAEQVFWMENGNIAYADSMTAEDPTYIFTEDTIPGTINLQNYTVITVGDSTYLIWTETSEETGNVAMTTIYSGGVWSQAHKLTGLSEGNISALDGYQNGEGKLVLVYSAKNLCDNGEGGESFVTASLEKVVEAEQTVSLSGIGFEITEAVPGQTLPLTLKLVNTGNTLIDTLDVAIDSEAGERYTARLTGVNIGPGSEKQIEITDFRLSDNLTTRTVEEGQYVYTVTVNAADSHITAQNSFEIGYDDVYLYKRDMALVDNRENIVIDVVNGSGFSATNVHVRILADATDGMLVYDRVIEEIPGNEQVTIYLDVEDLSSTSLFASVSSDCTMSEETAYTELILSNPVTVATLEVEAYGCGSVMPGTPVDVRVGESVTISAVADEGYVFDGWYSYRDLVYLHGDENSEFAEIEMPAGDTTITARFVSQQPYDFTLSAESADLYAGEELRLTAQFASEAETGKVVWFSSDESVAAVTDRGVVTGLAEGTAEITAVCGGYVHTCLVTVRYVDVTEIHMIYPEMNLSLTESAPVELLTDPENGEASLVWSSSDESVAVVDQNGMVTAVGHGTAVITAAARMDASVTAQCTVNVVVPVTDILLDTMELNLTLTDNIGELNVRYMPEDADFGREITWSVDDPSILEMTSSGEYNEKLTVTALACGSATITARTEEGFEASCTVNIQDIVYASSLDQLQSEHYPYNVNTDCTWIYTDEDKDYMFLHFDEETWLSENDSLTVMDGAGNVLDHGEGGYFSDRWVLVEDSTVQIQLISGGDTSGYYGFRVDEITDTVSAEDLVVETWDVEYTGKELKPEFIVRLGSTQLTPGTHYTAKLSGNKNVGTGAVRIMGMGKFANIDMTCNFRVVPSYAQLEASVSAKGIVLSWNASKGAGGYWLYRSVDGDPMELYKTLGSSAKNFTDTNVSGEHYYEYMLIPYKNVKEGKETVTYEAWASGCDPITKLGPVTGLTVTTDQEDSATIPYQVSLEWNSVEGAEGYIVYLAEGNYDGYYRIASTSSTSYSNHWIYNGGKCSFYVVPYKYINGSQFEGGASNTVVTYGIYSPYVNGWSSDKGINLNYDYSYFEGKSGIELYRSDNGGAFKKIKTINTTSDYTYGTLLDSGAKKSGTYYQYKARIFVVDGKKTYYSPWSEVFSTMYLSPTTISAVKQADDGLEVTWKTVTGAGSYRIERYYYDGYGSENNVSFYYTVEDSKAKTHTFVDTSATEPGMYQYYVTACAAMGDVFYESNIGNGMMGCVLAAPELYDVRNAQKGTEVVWEWNNFASGFEVWRSTDGIKWSKVKTLSDNWLNDTGASKDGVTYTYKVRAYNKQKNITFYSDYSNEQSIIKLTPPKLKTMKVLPEGGFEITFNTVKNADGYIVNGYDGSSDQPVFHTEIIQDPKAKTYTVKDPGATAIDVEYVYEVMSYKNVGGQMSNASTWLYGYHFSAPSVMVESSEKGIRVSASAAGPANTYTVYRSEDGVKWKKLKTVNANEHGVLVYEDTSAKAGKMYHYQVEANNTLLNASTTLCSETVSCLCKVGPKMGKLTNEVDGIYVTWTAQKNMPVAEQYAIYRSWGSYDFELVGMVDGDMLAFLDSSIDRSDVNVYYKVGVIPAGETEPVAFSAVQMIYRMEAPYGLEIYHTGEKTADVVWNYDGFADGFEVRYITGKTTKTINAKNYWGYYPLTGLSVGKEYEISVRAYYTHGKTKYYSGWSYPVFLQK